MTCEQVIAELKKLGNERNVKTFKKHGAGDNYYGVSFGNLGKLKKKIKTDHELALELWESGNIDARILATMIADPDECTASVVDRWTNETTFHLLVDYIAGLAARTPFAVKQMEEWMKSREEYVRQCAYATLAAGLRDGLDVTDDDCRRYLETIEKEIHGSANRAKYAMNIALISIGIYRPALIEAAVDAAKRIGKVDVDHGDTSCKTPDAVPYIEKALKRRERR
jgi:3-methyladenine DNA glycosylase AlkD